jgi:hypothetical protein
LGGQPLLLGLVEPFHLPAGLWVAGAAVVQPHAEQVELQFQGDSPSAAGFAGEDGGVVGEHPSRDPVATKGLAEAGHDVTAGDSQPSVRGQV